LCLTRWRLEEIDAGVSDLECWDVISARALDQFVATRRRFGEVRTWLAAQLEVDDATDDWQRLMRWLLFFLPDRYETFTGNYSEIFARKAANLRSPTSLMTS
jgi:hypothetical protein